jgi:glycerol-1-phosphate dehydrogenase [NAD(P)+]
MERDYSAGGTAPRSWTRLIDDIVEGIWINPETGATSRVPYESIVISDTLDGREAELVRSLRLGSNHTVVVDPNTWEAYGAKVARALEALGPVQVVTLDHPKADRKTIADLTDRLAGAEGIVAVGSGTINDLCKFVAGQTGRRYAVFATAASMNGYTSTTASVTLENGLKVSLPAGAPAGLFIGLDVSAAAPPHLSAAGFADSVVRSVAQVDCWLAHRLLGASFSRAAFSMQEGDEPELLNRAGEIPGGGLDANGYLQRILSLCGLGVAVTGNTNHGSMGEHQISHYIDCFAGVRHPGTLHGQQVGVAVLTMARLQEEMLASERPPVLKPTVVDHEDMSRRMGADVATQCLREITPKLLGANEVARLNERLQEIWPSFRKAVETFRIRSTELEALLRAAGAPLTSDDLGLDVSFYREAVLHCREMRNRFSFLDLAADAGVLDEFVARQS